MLNHYQQLVATLGTAVGIGCFTAQAQQLHTPADCYQGPPSSAQACPKNLPLGRNYIPIKGREFKTYYGDSDKPVVCYEEQLMWKDENGCHQYCRIKKRCGDT